MNLESALVKNAQGRFYHLGCCPGDLAPFIFTCGDPHRARRIARHFDEIIVRRHNREFLTYTGSYKSIPVSVMATGIGAPASAIAIVEAAQCVSPATFIRLGSTGALQANIAVGDLVITESAIREENTTHFYAPPEFRPRAHPEVLDALKQAAVELQAPHHVGLTCTTSDFYAGQGRVVPGFPTLEPGKVARLQQQGVLNLEMEMSVYLALAAVSAYQLRAGGACAVFNNRITGGRFGSGKALRRAEKRLIAVAFRALEILAAKDRGTGFNA